MKKIIVTTLTVLSIAIPLSFAKEGRESGKKGSEHRDEHWKERIEKMSHEEHREYVAHHPELREEIYKHWEEKIETMSPEKREEFLRDHPEFREHIYKRWEEKVEKMGPEKREEFLKNHPEFHEHLKKHHHKKRK